MSAAGSVVFDPFDDVVAVRELHHLAATHASVLVATIAPDCRSAPGTVWAILRALGKEATRLVAGEPTWTDAERWLTAHGISELVVLRAQHLTEATCSDLKASASRAGAHLTIVVNERAQPVVRLPEADPSIAAAVLARIRRTPPATRPRPRWPHVPRSHALRLRFDCQQALEPQAFRRVDELLNATIQTAEAWLTAHSRPTTQALDRALSVLTAAPDPHQAHIRSCATQIALWRHGLAAPTTSPPTWPTVNLTDDDIRDVLAHTDAATGVRRLAELVTGLEPELLDLVGGDQITETSILATAIPAPTRPVTRALAPSTGPALRRPRHLRRERAIASRDGQQAPRSNAVPLIIGHLLAGRANSASSDEIPGRALRELDDLVDRRILNVDDGVYRASHVTLYSTYGSRWLPPEFTDIPMRQTTDTT